MQLAPSHSPIHRVQRLMGTVISIDVRGESVSEKAVGVAFDYLLDIEARFSPFLEDSEISRISRGELSMADASDDVRDVAVDCATFLADTAGAFDAWGHHADRRFDPTGMVKGWALDRAADVLIAAGARDLCINGGGDVIVRGEPEAGRSWKIGIRHPHLADQIAATIELGNGAVATSAEYERGAHIVDPRSGKRPEGLLSATVVAETLAQADAYATAVFAMGNAGPSWAACRDIALFAVTSDERVLTTQRMDRLLAISDG